jgi:hypothetical protein
MQPCTNGSDEKWKRLYIVHFVHYLTIIHDTKPTKCTTLLRHTDYNTTLNIPTCFGPQGIIIRESKQCNTAFSFVKLCRGVKEPKS